MELMRRWTEIKTGNVKHNVRPGKGSPVVHTTAGCNCGRFSSLSFLIFSFVPTSGVCICVGMCVCMHVRRPKVSTSYLLSLASSHLTFWGRVSLWTRRSPIWLDWLATNPETSSCLCLASRIIGVHGHPYFLFVFLFNTWVLGIYTEVLMLSWQVFYPQSFQHSSQLALKVQPNHEEEFLNMQ